MARAQRLGLGGRGALDNSWPGFSAGLGSLAIVMCLDFVVGLLFIRESILSLMCITEFGLEAHN